MPEHTPAPSPARSIYGFFMYLVSKTALVVYMVWAFLPDSCLNYFNIFYYPHKRWAVAVPIQCLVALTLFVFFIYPGLNMMMTPSIDSMETITDSFSKRKVKHKSSSDTASEQDPKCACRDQRKCLKSKYDVKPQIGSESSIPYARDLDIRVVCRKLYLKSQASGDM